MEDNQIQKIGSTLNDINSNLNEIKRILKILSIKGLKEIIESEINTADKRKVYDLNDGIRTTREISEISGVNIRYISEWGQDWEKKGLLTAESPSSRGKRKRIFSLDDLGIDSTLNEK